MIVPVTKMCGRPVADGEMYLAADEHGFRHPAAIASGPGAKERVRLYAAAEDLLKTCKTLLEICRWKCSPQDDVVLASGQSNHDALIAAMEVITRAEGGS